MSAGIPECPKCGCRGGHKWMCENSRESSFAAPTGLGALVEFIKAKLADAEKSLKCREDMEKTWSGGTDKSWRAVGCGMNKEQRLKESATHGRIAVKCRREVEMFKAVLAKLEAPNAPGERRGELPGT